jgi:inorganic pyrophosphatase
VPPHLLAEIRHFFEVYKAVEPAKSTEVGRWAGRPEALQEMAEAIERFDRE